jgi:hypothetical protein
MVGLDGHRGQPLRLGMHPGRRDIEFAIFGLALTIAGATLPAEYVGDYILALPHHLMPSSAAYWLLMQVGMIIGYFFTSWPANVWLVKRGIKVLM